MMRPTATRVSNFMQSLRGWLVRVGLASPPHEASAKSLTNEQRQARRQLRFLAVPLPPRSPR